MPSDKMHKGKKKLTAKQLKALKLLAKRLKKQQGLDKPFATAGRRRFKGV